MTELVLLESGRRGTARRRSNPRRGQSAYQKFVSVFADQHPGLSGPPLIERAAAAWGRMGNPMAESNPRKRKTARKAPKRRSTRRRNPATAVANPAKRRPVRRRRNPLGIEKVTQKALGVSPEQMLVGGANFVAVAWVGGKIAEALATTLNITERAPADRAFDLAYVFKKTIPTLGAAVISYFAAKGLKLGADLVDAVAITGASAVATQAVAASRQLPVGVLADGSVMIGHNPGQRPTWIPPLPPPMRALPDGSRAPSFPVMPASETVQVPPAPSF